MRNIYTTYASDTDITFILADVIEQDEIISTEVLGFYYGSPNDADTENYIGKLKATF